MNDGYDPYNHDGPSRDMFKALSRVWDILRSDPTPAPDCIFVDPDTWEMMHGRRSRTSYPYGYC